MKIPSYYIFYSKFRFTLFLVFFLFLFTSKSFANCINIKASEVITEYEFLNTGDGSCDNRLQEKSLLIYNNDGKFDSIINSDYTISFVFERTGRNFANDGNEQTLFAIYGDANFLIARAYLRYDSEDKGQFAYYQNGDIVTKINMSTINGDSDILTRA